MAWHALDDWAFEIAIEDCPNVNQVEDKAQYQ